MRKTHELGYGLYIGINDCLGTPIHIGDTLQFNTEEYGEECIFVLTLRNGEIAHPGSTSDLSSFCTVVKACSEKL